MRNLFERISNENVNLNADYWAKLGSIMQENVSLGIDNSIYTNICQSYPHHRGWFDRLLAFNPRDFIKIF